MTDEQLDRTLWLLRKLSPQVYRTLALPMP